MIINILCASLCSHFFWFKACVFITILFILPFWLFSDNILVDIHSCVLSVWIISYFAFTKISEIESIISRWDRPLCPCDFNSKWTFFFLHYTSNYYPHLQIYKWLATQLLYFPPFCNTLRSEKRAIPTCRWHTAESPAQTGWTTDHPSRRDGHLDDRWMEILTSTEQWPQGVY